MQYDRNGTLVRTTQPVRQLNTNKRVLTIDSRDRDPTKYVKLNAGSTTSDPGDYVVYLPRVYENVVSLRLRSAVVKAPESGGFLDNYILLSLEGLNKIDETAYAANRAGLIDNSFAKVSNPNITSGSTNNTFTIFYNDKVDEENIVQYTPAIGRLDRIHVTWKYHPGIASATVGDVTGQVINAPITFGANNHTLTFEIEYMENSFTNFSSFETRLDSVNYVR